MEELHIAEIKPAHALQTRAPVVAGRAHVAIEHELGGEQRLKVAGHHVLQRAALAIVDAKVTVAILPRDELRVR